MKSYATALQVVLLAAAVPAYGALATRLAGRRLVNVFTALFIGCVPLFYLAAQACMHVGVPFFLWIGAIQEEDEREAAREESGRLSLALVDLSQRDAPRSRC